MPTDTQRNDRLTKARVLLLLDHPFFGTLATRLANEFDTGVETSITDGKRIRWNPEYLDGLLESEVRGVMAHNVLHVANGHTWRRGARDGKAWNAACDRAINSILLEAGLKLPAGSPTGVPGAAAEALYTAPAPSDDAENGQKPGQGGSGGAGASNGPGGDPNGPKGQPGASGKDGKKDNKPGCGEVEDAPADEVKELEAEWKVAVAQAALGQGTLPADLARMVDAIVNPGVPWETVLRDFVERTARNDYNWARPNRRYLAAGIVLPSLVSEELPEIVLAVDTSGSIDQAVLDKFAAEASAILGAYETTIRVVYADARVQHVDTVTRADLPLQLKPHGGGGTDFRPAFNWVAENGLTPACLVYLTDGMGRYPDAEPDFPVLWAMTTDRQGPFGETVRMQ